MAKFDVDPGIGAAAILPPEPVESFVLREHGIDRGIQLRNGPSVFGTFLDQGEAALRRSVDMDHAERAFLRSKQTPREPFSPTRTIRCADLFAGCGGISLGAREASRALGYAFEVALAVDADADALGIYGKNFLGATCETTGAAPAGICGRTRCCRASGRDISDSARLVTVFVTILAQCPKSAAPGRRFAA